MNRFIFCSEKAGNNTRPENVSKANLGFGLKFNFYRFPRFVVLICLFSACFSLFNVIKVLLSGSTAQIKDFWGLKFSLSLFLSAYLLFCLLLLLPLHILTYPNQPVSSHKTKIKNQNPKHLSKSWRRTLGKGH